MGRESLLTHTHGAEVTAGATLVGKNWASHQKITWNLWVKLRKRELFTDKDSSSSWPSVIISVAVKGAPPASLTLPLSPWIYYSFLFPAHLRGCMFPQPDMSIINPQGYHCSKTGRTEPKAVLWWEERLPAMEKWGEVSLHPLLLPGHFGKSSVPTSQKSGGLLHLYFPWVGSLGPQVMCMWLYHVPSEMMKEHIAYFHNNKLGSIYSDLATLPGEFLPRWQNEATSDFFSQSKLKIAPKKFPSKPKLFIRAETPLPPAHRYDIALICIHLVHWG